MNIPITAELSLDISDTRTGVIRGDGFCLRKASAIFVQDRYWVYADIVPWDNPHWPNTYDTSIGLFSSEDCSDWKYHGIVVKHKNQDFRYDFGGVTTPDAIMFSGKIFLFYAGKENLDGGGKRHILCATSDSPDGIFIKHKKPIAESHADHIHFDDPIAILSEDKKRIELYYRYANHKAGFYEIMKVTSSDGENWSAPITVLKSSDKIRAYETAQGCRITVGDKSSVLLWTFDHFATGEFKTGIRISSDGNIFSENDCLYLDDYWAESIPHCGLQTICLSKDESSIEYLGIAKNIDNVGHYGIEIYSVRIIQK